MKSISKAFCNSNGCVKTCVHLAINGSGSSVSGSINVVSQSMNCNRNLLYALPSVFSSKAESYIHRIYIAPDYFCVANIKDLLYIRDSKCSQFNSFELTCLLEHAKTEMTQCIFLCSDLFSLLFLLLLISYASSMFLVQSFLFVLLLFMYHSIAYVYLSV